MGGGTYRLSVGGGGEGGTTASLAEVGGGSNASLVEVGGGTYRLSGGGGGGREDLPPL